MTPKKSMIQLNYFVLIASAIVFFSNTPVALSIESDIAKGRQHSSAKQSSFHQIDARISDLEDQLQDLKPKFSVNVVAVEKLQSEIQQAQTQIGSLKSEADRVMGAATIGLSTSNTAVQYLGGLVMIVTFFFAVVSIVVSLKAWKKLEEAEIIAGRAMAEIEARRVRDCMLDLFSRDELVRRSAATQLGAAPRETIQKILLRLIDYLEGESPSSPSFPQILALVARENSGAIEEILARKIKGFADTDQGGFEFYSIASILTPTLWDKLLDPILRNASEDQIIWILSVKATDPTIGTRVLVAIRIYLSSASMVGQRVWGQLFHLAKNNAEIANLVLDLKPKWSTSPSSNQLADILVSADAPVDQWEKFLRSDTSSSAFVRFVKDVAGAEGLLRQWHASGHLVPPHSALVALSGAGYASLAEALGFSSIEKQSTAGAAEMIKAQEDTIGRMGLIVTSDGSVVDSGGKQLEVKLEVDTLFGPQLVRKFVQINEQKIPFERIPKPTPGAS